LAKRSKAAPDARALPSRDEVVAFIADQKGKVGKRELARAFGVQGGDRIWLKQMLKDLEAEGVVDRRRGSIHKAGRLPAVVLADVTGRDRDGELVAVPEEWDVEHGETPKILVTSSRKPRPNAPAPGVGDRVLLRVEPATDGGAPGDGAEPAPEDEPAAA
jgi:ribonuclease R